MRLPNRAKATSTTKTTMAGKWRITEMDLWDQEAIDLLGPAFIEIKGEGGQFRFIAVDGWIDPLRGALACVVGPTRPARASFPFRGPSSLPTSGR